MTQHKDSSHLQAFSLHQAGEDFHRQVSQGDDCFWYERGRYGGLFFGRDLQTIEFRLYQPHPGVSFHVRSRIRPRKGVGGTVDCE